MTDFRDYKTNSRFSFAINAGWSARLDGKGVTSMGPAKTNEPDLELAAFAYGWTRCDESEKARAAASGREAESFAMWRPVTIEEFREMYPGTGGAALQAGEVA